MTITITMNIIYRDYVIRNLLIPILVESTIEKINHTPKYLYIEQKKIYFVPKIIYYYYQFILFFLAKYGET